MNMMTRDNKENRKYLAINAGSSSLKFALYTKGGVLVAEGRWEKDAAAFVFKANGNKDEGRVAFQTHEEAFEYMLKSFVRESVIKNEAEIVKVAHRAVHGGLVFTEPTMITPEVLEQFEGMLDLAPLHNPANLACAKLAVEKMPHAKHYFVFDTAFHSTIPEVNRIYALPYEYYEKGIQVYGFHGISHEDMTIRTAQYLGKPKEEVNLIICHLGNGASITTVKAGKSFDTTMGYTPLDGLTMGTRTGHLDPGVVLKVVEECGNVEEANKVLNKQSGLLGISGGTSSDMRYLLELEERGYHKAGLAVKKFVQEVIKACGSAYFQLGGKVDAIVFTGGIGENSKEIVRRVVKDLEPIGIILSKDPNELTTAESKIPVLQFAANEELAMIKQIW